MATKQRTSVPSVSVESLVAEHASTPGPKRRSLRDSWTRLGMEAVMAGDTDLARVYAEATIQASEQASSRQSVAAEIPWRALVAERIQSLRLAADLLESTQVRPAGTPEDVDLSDVSEMIVDTDRIAENARALARTRLAGQRNVPEFISERVAELGSGWHTASDLARGQVDAPGTGAIGAVYTKMISKGFEVSNVEAGRNDKGVSAFRLA